MKERNVTVGGYNWDYPTLSRPLAGAVLAGYRVERVLGEGGFGTVVAARDVVTGERVAIKVLKSADDPVIVERFLREARAVQRLHGAGVPRFIEQGRLPTGEHYMVMEYLEGQDLRQELTERGPFAVDDAVRCILRACDVLARAHAIGIVHRDVKSANLFRAVEANGARALKVLDFGVAHSLDPVETSLTRSAALLGSPRYMAPEQISDSRSVDERTDIWGLGATLFELLTGVPPFHGRTLIEMISHVQFEAPKPLRELRPELPEGLVRVVMRCLEKRADRRFPNAPALADALARYAAPEGDHASLEEAPPPPSALEPRREESWSDPDLMQPATRTSSPPPQDREREREFPHRAFTRWRGALSQKARASRTF